MWDGAERPANPFSRRRTRTDAPEGIEASHAPSTYPLAHHDREAFARWFADWWLRRGHRLLADGADR